MIKFGLAPLFLSFMFYAVLQLCFMLHFWGDFIFVYFFISPSQELPPT